MTKFILSIIEGYFKAKSIKRNTLVLQSDIPINIDLNKVSIYMSEIEQDKTKGHFKLHIYYNLLNYPESRQIKEVIYSLESDCIDDNKKIFELL